MGPVTFVLTESRFWYLICGLAPELFRISSKLFPRGSQVLEAFLSLSKFRVFVYIFSSDSLSTLFRLTLILSLFFDDYSYLLGIYELSSKTATEASDSMLSSGGSDSHSFLDLTFNLCIV